MVSDVGHVFSTHSLLKQVAQEQLQMLLLQRLGRPSAHLDEGGECRCGVPQAARGKVLDPALQQQLQLLYECNKPVAEGGNKQRIGTRAEGTVHWRPEQ